MHPVEWAKKVEELGAGEIFLNSIDKDGTGTGYDLNLIKFSKNSNLLLTECSFANGMKVKGHLIPSECGEMAKQANVGKLVLTHIYPTSSEAVRLKEAKKIFRNTILAEDLLTIDI